MQLLLDSAGADALEVLKLWWTLFFISLFVFATVTGVLLWSLVRHDSSSKTVTRYFVGAVSLTLVLLISLIVATFQFSVTPPSHEQTPQIEVIGKRWWWEVNYLDKNGEPLFKTANEIHLPVNQDVVIRLLSDNVIHSFWVPQLGGKVDMIPGKENYIRLNAAKEGTYRGVCAEYCGLQHTFMALHAVVQSEEDYQTWIKHQQTPAKSFQDELSQRGAQVFKEAECMNCHSIKGFVTAVAQEKPLAVGPDLTHLMSRQFLASGILENTKGHLGGWIANPQGIKPGAMMPPLNTSAENFEALLHYLSGLE